MILPALFQHSNAEIQPAEKQNGKDDYHGPPNQTFGVIHLEMLVLFHPIREAVKHVQDLLKSRYERSGHNDSSPDSGKLK